MPSIVRPQFGPTLPTLLGPKWRGCGRAPRAAIVAAAVLLAASAIFVLLGGGSARRTVEVAAPVAFQLQYDGDSLQQRVAVGAESLRLESRASESQARSFTVQPLRLAAYSGSIQGVLPLTAATLTEQMRSADPTFITRAEGPVMLNEQPGYQIFYQSLRDRRTIYGRRVLLFPAETGARSGVDVVMTSARNQTTQTAVSVGQQAPLREPYESIVIGD